MDAFFKFFTDSGFVRFFEGDGWKQLVMIAIACVLLYLAIGKKFEPLLLLPIAFGMLLTNLPGANMFHEEMFAGGHVHWDMLTGGSAGLLDWLYLGVKLGIYPCLIFFGVGAMTDFAPLIANPKSMLMGAAAQLGIFLTFLAASNIGALGIEGLSFTAQEAASIGIIGGADGPTAIFVTTKLAPQLLGPIAVAAYSYMALVPVIQPPIMRLLTTEKERKIVMKPLRTVSKREQILFPIVVTVFVALLVPDAASLVGSLMLGNLFRESGVTERLSKTVQNELCNIVTIFLGVTVGATATAATFLDLRTIAIIVMGVIAFGMGTAGGLLLAKLMNVFLPEGKKINPLIGSAGVSAVPMAARVSQVEGQKANPSNFLLMHAMGPNVAGVIGSAIAAGALINMFG
ncbi:MAG: sodium ion-translocating decarboxylase subunit beta [Clostridia bacterium]|nr:sodium ion-translocating decarboxylase subunit beta [Clostridia bacterium]